MLVSQQAIINYFQKNNLTLAEEKALSADEVYQLYISAGELGKEFLCFVHYAIINADRNGTAINFDSWKELHETYSFFTLGFSGNQKN